MEVREAVVVVSLGLMALVGLWLKSEARLRNR